MAKAHGNPKTNGQLISIGMIIITNACIFADAVEKWNNKADAKKTWPHFKNHFTAAQSNIKNEDPTTPQNHLVTTINKSTLSKKSYNNYINEKKPKLKFKLRKKTNASLPSINQIKSCLKPTHPNLHPKPNSKSQLRQSANSNPKSTTPTISIAKTTTMMATEEDAEATDKPKLIQQSSNHKSILLYTQSMQPR